MNKSSPQISKCVYVDLSNLYGGMSELLHPGEYFDFSTIMPIIDGIFGGVDQFKVYGAYMGLASARNRNEQLFIKAQNEFFNSARLPGVHFGQGNISAHGQEKGVDMQLGVDMVNDAHLKKYTDAIILSGDADFFTRSIWSKIWVSTFTIVLLLRDIPDLCLGRVGRRVSSTIRPTFRADYYHL